ncbi:MAG: class I SAM-dependent methyltransferase [Synergistaceae bacterium]|jgi:SAM-dependent methyltransferase|nr:class I SAM-dependent methyltransferase [Synergistaceae bacterium]
MEKYLKANFDYWQSGYIADNVESFVFRIFGRILKPELGLSGKNNEKLLDFGCGGGAALSFFDRNGFDVYGIDISEVDINHCKERMPRIPDHFAKVDPVPKVDDVFFDGDFDLVTAVQSLYYYSNDDLEIRLISLKNQMKPGAVIYATMMGSKCWYYDNSVDYKDGLREVDIDTPRLKIKNYFVNFTHSKEDLTRKFSMFETIHVGYYDAHYIETEGSDFHWTFIGRA